MFAANYASSIVLSTISAISYNHEIVGLAGQADNFYVMLVGILEKSNTIDLRQPMLSQLVNTTKAVIPVNFTKSCVAANHMLALNGFLRIG